MLSSIVEVSAALKQSCWISVHGFASSFFIVRLLGFLTCEKGVNLCTWWDLQLYMFYFHLSCIIGSCGIHDVCKFMCCRVCSVCSNSLLTCVCEVLPISFWFSNAALIDLDFQIDWHRSSQIICRFCQDLADLDYWQLLGALLFGSF